MNTPLTSFLATTDFFSLFLGQNFPKVYNASKEEGKGVNLRKNITRKTKKSIENGLGLKLD